MHHLASSAAYPYSFSALVAVIVGVVAVAAVRRMRVQRADAEQLGQLATSLGLSFQSKAEREFVKAWSIITPLPARGSVSNVVFGELTTPAGGRVQGTIFQHRYMVSTGQSAHMVTHAVWAVDTPGWPTLSVTRRNKLRVWLGGLGKGREYRADPPFEKAWIIKCADAAFLARWLTPDIKDRIAACGWANAWWAAGDKLAVIARGELQVEHLVRGIEAVGGVWDAVDPALKAASTDEAAENSD